MAAVGPPSFFSLIQESMGLEVSRGSGNLEEKSIDFLSTQTSQKGFATREWSGVVGLITQVWDAIKL